MPPAAMTTSPPCTSSTGQAPPNGPRTLSTWPGSVRQIAAVARPTERTVWTSGSGRSGLPLIEIGTSPAPAAASMLNWPGVKSSGCPERGLSSSVQVSMVSWRLPNTSNGTGTIGPRSAAARSAGAAATTVDIEELEPGRLQALEHGRGEATHELVAELVIGLAFPAQANTVECHQAAGHDRP